MNGGAPTPSAPTLVSTDATPSTPTPSAPMPSALILVEIDRVSHKLVHCHFNKFYVAIYFSLSLYIVKESLLLPFVGQGARRGT
jgi:hypothetical protein